jgi:hypothetical protein
MIFYDISWQQCIRYDLEHFSSIRFVTDELVLTMAARALLSFLVYFHFCESLAVCETNTLNKVQFNTSMLDLLLLTTQYLPLVLK